MSVNFENVGKVTNIQPVWKMVFDELIHRRINQVEHCEKFVRGYWLSFVRKILTIRTCVLWKSKTNCSVNRAKKETKLITTELGIQRFVPCWTSFTYNFPIFLFIYSFTRLSIIIDLQILRMSLFQRFQF